MHTHGGKVLAVAGLAARLLYPSAAPAQPAPSLGAAASFAVLGGSSVSSSGSGGHISGNVGVSPGKTVTGFPKDIFALGEVRNDLAGGAQVDDAAAYEALAGRGCGRTLQIQDLGGQRLGPGVYCFSSSSVRLTGPLILEGDGIWIFQVRDSLTIAPGSSVLMVKGSAINVFWQVGGSALIGADASFFG